MFRIAGAGPAILLPIVGILAVTSEWSQRTTLTTFVLVPQRWRVVAAKVLAGLAIGALSVLVCLAAALVAAAVSGAPGGWDLDLRTGLYQALSQMLGILGGTAFGMLFLSSPVAIVAYFALPTAWGITAELVSALREAGQWLDTSQTFASARRDAAPERARSGRSWRPARACGCRCRWRWACGGCCERRSRSPGYGDADERSRTSTSQRTQAPEACASTSSATSAWGRNSSP